MRCPRWGGLPDQPERRWLDIASPPPVSVASAAPRDGPRSSRHVFTDGARVAAGRHRLLGDLPGVPHVGHLRALLLQRAVGLLPARVPRLRIERAGLAPRRARRIARVGGRRRIDEVANGDGVQDVGAAIEVDQVPSPGRSATARSCSPAGAAGGWISSNCACCSNGAASRPSHTGSVPVSATGRPRRRTIRARSSRRRSPMPSATRSRRPTPARTCSRGGDGSWTTGPLTSVRNAGTRWHGAGDTASTGAGRSFGQGDQGSRCVREWPRRLRCNSPQQARKSGDHAPLPVIRDRILTEVDVKQSPAQGP